MWGYKQIFFYVKNLFIIIVVTSTKAYKCLKIYKDVAQTINEERQRPLQTDNDSFDKVLVIQLRRRIGKSKNKITTRSFKQEIFIEKSG